MCPLRYIAIAVSVTIFASSFLCQYCKKNKRNK